MKILVFSPYLPAIDTSACARKIYDFIVLLHQRGHFIFLLSFCNEEDKERIKAIKPYCAQLYLEYLKDYSRYPYRSYSFTETIDSLCRNRTVDILQCENSYLSRYISTKVDIPRLLVEHEILSVSYWQRAELEANFIDKFIWYARAMKKTLEQKKWYRKFNKVVVFCEEDKSKIPKLCPQQLIEVIPLWVNLNDYPRQHTEKKFYDLVFVGNFSHLPNVDAALYFYKDILPLIKYRFPNVSVVLAGANPPLTIKEIAKSDKTVSVTGYTEDIKEAYVKSRVFVAPIRYGTGMRFKILEALALDLPVVSTSLGARGIIFKENIKIADTEKEFATAVIDLLNNPDKCAILAENGRKLIEKYYNWETLLDKYEDIYRDLLKKI